MNSTQTKFRLYSLLCVSLLLLPFSTPLSIGCAGIDEPDVTESLLFNPSMIGQPELSPLFLSHHGYFETNDYERDLNSNNKNIEEWNKRLGIDTFPDQLNWLIYKSSVEEINQISEGKIIKTESGPELSTFIPGLLKTKNIREDLNYLRFAKQAEKFSINYFYSWQENTTDTTSVLQFAEKIKQEFSKTKDPFLAGRYGFQIIKTLHYIGNYDEAISFYEAKLKDKKAFTESIRWRNLGYYAACLYKKQRYVESNLIYADIFRGYEPQRLDAYTSFHPLEEKDWTETLKKANREQKITLWMMFGLYNDPLKGLEEILKLDLQNKEMELLLVRAVNIAENNIIKNPVYGWNEEYYLEGGPENYPLSSYRSWSSVNKDQLNRLVAIINLRQKESRAGTVIWTSAKAYAQYLNGDYEAATQTLDEALLSSESNIPAWQQNNITRALIYVSSQDYFDKEQEEKLASLIATINNDNSPKRDQAERYILRIAAKIYERMGQTAKVWLCTRNEDQDLNTQGQVSELRAFMERKDLNVFERYLCDSYPIQLADIYDVEGTEMMYDEEWSKAVSTFKKSPQAGTQSTYGDPFLIHIQDCHDCDHGKENSTTYTKLTFSKKMNEIQKKIVRENDPEKKSLLCFEYANGLYNMTWYGNARALYSTRVRYTEDSYYLSTEVRSTRPFYDCSRARTWYETAMELTSNRELQTKYAWMAAKCEQAEITNKSENYDQLFIPEEYFKRIKEKYSDTKYYQEILQECGYFCTYNFGPKENCIKNKEE